MINYCHADFPDEIDIASLLLPMELPNQTALPLKDFVKPLPDETIDLYSLTATKTPSKEAPRPKTPSLTPLVPATVLAVPSDLAIRPNQSIFIFDVQNAFVMKGGEARPAELAIAEFTFTSGLVRDFHRFVYHGPVPAEYRNAAAFTTKKFHGIPLELDVAIRDHDLVWEHIARFFRTARVRPPYLAFSKAPLNKNASWVWLAQQAKRRLPFAIVDIEVLFAALVQGAEYPLEYRKLFSDLFAGYRSSRIGKCDWHERTPALASKDCALGNARVYS